MLRHSLKEDETASVARDFDFVGIQEFLDSLQANSQVDDEEWDRKSKAACATILYYENHECTGEPTHTYTVPTMTMPGSPCRRYHRIEVSHIRVLIQHSHYSLVVTLLLCCDTIRNRCYHVSFLCQGSVL